MLRLVLIFAVWQTYDMKYNILVAFKDDRAIYMLSTVSSNRLRARVQQNVHVCITIQDTLCRTQLYDITRNVHTVISIFYMKIN